MTSSLIEEIAVLATRNPPAACEGHEAVVPHCQPAQGLRESSEDLVAGLWES